MSTNTDDVFINFMMKHVPGETTGSAVNDGDDGKHKNKKKSVDLDDLSEEEKELQEAKKISKAKQNNMPTNPAMVLRQTAGLAFFYTIVGLLILGLMIYSKKNKGWVNRGINKGINLILFGNANAR
ncbi:MAG: hypothetical protein LBG48_02500 [Rickettsiales bacterium]|jgi:hypothetical protein|nr:hypothetical protein [Rickettsiales bacterium]